MKTINEYINEKLNNEIEELRNLVKKFDRSKLFDGNYVLDDSVPEESNFTLRLSYYHSNYFFPYANNNFSFLYKGVNNL